MLQASRDSTISLISSAVPKQTCQQMMFNCSVLSTTPNIFTFSMNCTLCQGRSEGGNARAPKSPNNTASTFFNTVQLLPKDLRFEYGGAKLASCLGRHTTSLRRCGVPRSEKGAGDCSRQRRKSKLFSDSFARMSWEWRWRQWKDTCQRINYYLFFGAQNWDRLNSFINTKKAFKKLSRKYNLGIWNFDWKNTTL